MAYSKADGNIAENALLMLASKLQLTTATNCSVDKEQVLHRQVLSLRVRPMTAYPAVTVLQAGQFFLETCCLFFCGSQSY